MADQENTPHVVIIGAGFAGLYAAKALKGAPLQVTIIDRRNHHLFQPLLYQVATAGLSAPDIAEPIRKVLRHQKNARVLMAEVESVDLEADCVILDDGKAVPYDYLIVAAGARYQYFGHDREWEHLAPGLKSVEDAFEIRRRIISAFEKAELEEDPEKRKHLLTFTIVGGGPTGVELAGQIAEISKHTFVRDYRNFDPRNDVRVILLEAMDRVLPPYPEDLSESARVQLEQIGVEVRTGKFVKHIDEEKVVFGDEEIHTRCVMWAAGVEGVPLGAKLTDNLTKSKQVPVSSDLSLPGHPNVFVAGDLAYLERDDGSPVPQIAPAAIQMGKQAAQNIRLLARGKQSEPFRYIHKGDLATIGRSAAVAHVGRFKASGFVAWMLWLVVHLFWLIGFRNRVFVFLEWLLAYLRYYRSARVITGWTRHKSDKAFEHAATQEKGEPGMEIVRGGEG